MSYLFRNILPALQTLEIIGNSNNFEDWLKKTHPEKSSKDIFEGYIFALQCCLNSFCDGIASDSTLQISNDFMLDRAIAELIPLHHIDNSCEKTIFLKNLKPFIKNILKSSSYPEVKTNIEIFSTKIGVKFQNILKNNVSTSKEIEKDIAVHLSLIDFGQTFLVQITNNGPMANSPNPISVEWTPTERKEVCFEGYKYAVQYFWFSVLGKDYFQTSLINMHTAEKFRGKKHIITETNCGANFNPFKNREFNLEEQTDFDSYFYRIKHEITEPLSEKYNFAIFTIEDYFIFTADQYNKEDLFSELLDGSRLSGTFESLSWNDKIRNKLYWYSCEIIDTESSSIHSGIASFNTMLAGTVTLKSDASEFSKIVVARFTHPLPGRKDENDYSYGVIVDAKSAAGHYSSGWTIYLNACGDYSGTSGSEHKKSEELIAKYLKEGKIELRELVIPLVKFKEFTNEHSNTQETLSIMEQNKLIPDILQKSKAHLFELFVHYLFSKEYSKTFGLILNANKKSKEGEIDLVLQNSTEVILIECKLDANNYDVSEEIIDKLEKKAKKFKDKKISCQYWFWEELSTQNQAIFNSKNIIPVIVSSRQGHPLLHGVDFKQIDFIMQDYRIGRDFDLSNIHIDFENDENKDM